MFFVIIWISKFLGGLSRLFGRGGGSALPGLFAEQSDDEILAHLGKRLKVGSVVITGTNGKTTTTKMVQEILESVGYKVVTNGSGSNLSRGIVSTLIDKISWSGKFTADIGLFEVDEASMPAVCSALKPKAVLVLNLFRDQLDRYGELDTTAGFIGKAIEPLDTQVYLNADDPLVASLAQYAKNPVHYFGVDKAETHKLAHDLAADSDHCPFDGHPLDYSRNFFGHIGHYKCPLKDFKRPEPETEVTEYTPGQAFEITHGHQKEKLYLPLPGLYNAYNALAAANLCVGLGIELKRVVGALERATAAFGRVERLDVRGRIVYLLLIKNPTGFNQVIQTFLAGDKGHSIMIAINDNFADGRDVSWLWDVAVEEMRVRGNAPALARKLKAKSDEVLARNPELKSAKVEHQITISGIRATDMALRLKYAGLSSYLQPDLEKAFNLAVDGAAEGETVYVLPTYTAMLELRERIRSQGLVKGRWV